MWDRFNPGGFYARATGGAGEAEVSACGMTFNLQDNNLVSVLCGSLTLEVVSGPVKIALGAGTFASVPTGGAVKVVELSTGQFQVENLGTTTVTVVDAHGNVLFTIAAGKSATFEGRHGERGCEVRLRRQEIAAGPVAGSPNTNRRQAGLEAGSAARAPRSLRRARCRGKTGRCRSRDNRGICAVRARSCCRTTART